MVSVVHRNQIICYSNTNHDRKPIGIFPDLVRVSYLYLRSYVSLDQKRLYR